MDDSASTGTSIDDNTENFCDNPTRDTLTEGIMGLVKPSVDQLDQTIQSTRICQMELKQKLETLHDEIKQIMDCAQNRYDLDIYLKKLLTCKHRCTVVQGVLQTVQERLNKIHIGINAKKNNIANAPKNKSEVVVNKQNEQVIETVLLLNNTWDQVYEPSEDTFLLLDAIQLDLNEIKQRQLTTIIEIGSGSGTVIASIAKHMKFTCFAVDLNPHACLMTRTIGQITTNKNVKEGEVLCAPVECLNMDLLTMFKDKNFDLILFNPPYVTTESSDVTSADLIVRSWAGGKKGREVIDRLLDNIDIYLNDNGLFYLVVSNENDPNDILNQMRAKQYHGLVVLQRKLRGEFLKVIKFYKI